MNKLQMRTEKKNNFTLNIKYSLYISKSICFLHRFVYHGSILYEMLLWFFKVESAVMEMIIPDFNKTIIKNIIF